MANVANEAKPAASYEDFQRAFGISTEAPETEPAPEPTAAPEPTEAPTEAQGEKAPEVTPPPTEQPGTEPQTEEPKAKAPEPAEMDTAAFKANKAFADMRVKTKKYETALSQVGKVLGIEETDTDRLLDAIQEAALKGQAKQSGIPESVLKELTTLKQQSVEAEAYRRESIALAGFQKVKDEFGLEQKDLATFAETLHKDGVNPFASPVDLKKEYIARNYDNLLAKAREAGAREEAARASKAQSKSTNPGNKQGGGDVGSPKPAQINTVKEFEAFASQHFQK